LIDRRIHRLLGLGVIALLVAFAPARALGQLDAGIVTAVSLSDEQKAAVRAYVEANSKNLMGEDAERRQTDKKALLAPLENAGASVSFRQTYTAALLPVLRAAPANPRQAEVVGEMALAIAGDLATIDACNFAVTSLKAEKPSIRYAAAYALRRTFEAVQRVPSNANPALQDAQLRDLVNKVATHGGTEQDALVTEACIRAVLGAATIDAIRSDAVMALQGLVHKVTIGRLGKPVDEGVIKALLHAGTGTRDILTNMQANLSPAAQKAGGELGGRLLAYVMTVLNEKKLPVGDNPARAALANLATTGQNVVALAGKKMNPSLQVPAGDLGRPVRAGNVQGDAEYITGVTGQFLGPTGVLTRPPFGFPAGHFGR